ncbi:hypothetical protein ES708_30079 [subsurface metagenome]
MIIKCFRCSKEIDTPNASNADYIMAEDTKETETRESLAALKHNQATLKKESRKKEIMDDEYDAAVVASYEEAERNLGEDLVKVIVKPIEVEIQKTGIICPECCKPTDFVIWGVHKEK